MVFLVHRPDLEHLVEACRYIQSCFRRPAWVEREQYYAWNVWLQTLADCVGSADGKFLEHGSSLTLFKK